MQKQVLPANKQNDSCQSKSIFFLCNILEVEEKVES